MNVNHLSVDNMRAYRLFWHIVFISAFMYVCVDVCVSLYSRACVCTV